jgi:hypothetical protein
VLSLAQRLTRRKISEFFLNSVPWLETENWSVSYPTLGEAQKVIDSVDRLISDGGGSLAKFGSSTTAFKGGIGYGVRA